jgi:hypothetical protein
MVRSPLRGFAMRSPLRGFATRSPLRGFATLAGFAGSPMRSASEHDRLRARISQHVLALGRKAGSLRLRIGIG